MSTIDYVRKLGYTNVQNYINNGPHGTIDESRLKRMTTFMTNNGWVELSGDELFNHVFEARDMIKYITNEKPSDGGIRNIYHEETGETDVAVYGPSANKFRSGGWVVNRDGGIMEGDNNKRYILYKPHNLTQPPICVQLENISKLYVFGIELHEDMKSKRPVKYKRPGKQTKYPVCAVDSNGDTVTIYNAESETKRKEFMGSKKFKRAIDNGWSFSETN